VRLPMASQAVDKAGPKMIFFDRFHWVSNQKLWSGCARSFSAHGPDFLHGAPPTAACAAFINESRMKFANANKFFRKSGCTLVRTWGTRPVPTGFC
jgi:hypothetical protein